MSQGDEQRELKPTDQRRTRHRAARQVVYGQNEGGEMMRRIEIVPGDMTKGTSDERLERIDGWGQSSYCELGEERRRSL